MALVSPQEINARSDEWRWHTWKKMEALRDRTSSAKYYFRKNATAWMVVTRYWLLQDDSFFTENNPDAEKLEKKCMHCDPLCIIMENLYTHLLVRQMSLSSTHVFCPTYLSNFKYWQFPQKIKQDQIHVQNRSMRSCYCTSLYFERPNYMATALIMHITGLC